ncbi:MAG: hypothetical protein KDA96_00570 [Planctomycetaceae bacterium]|nr:hypothetical protein [Planctomycetaceae bacterium]
MVFEPRTSTATQSRLVSADGCTFRVSWRSRDADQSELSPLKHGVSSERIVNTISNRLVHHLDTLRTTYQWSSSLLQSNEVCQVVIRDLGPGLEGAAVTGGSAEPYLAFNCRPVLSDPDAEQIRLGNVALHELVHLLQFATETWKYWPARGRWGLNDPNWWLHEAVALAIEATAGESVALWFPWLWDWAVSPHVSIESDSSGSAAAPFLMFLINRCGPSLPAMIYSLTPGDVVSMGAADLLDHAISRVDSSRNLADEFLTFCTHAGLLGVNGCELDPLIETVVGRRARTARHSEVGTQQWNTDGGSIEHLACRYFEFVPRTGTRCRVEIADAAAATRSSIKATCTVIDRNANAIRSVHQVPVTENEPATTITLRDGEWLLTTVVNTAFGSGWATKNQPRFSLRISDVADV